MEMIIKRGAEAEIILSEWMGRKVIIKRRVKKGYRIEEIDKELRMQRTKKEALLMAEARKAGASVPIIYDINLSDMTITMQYLEGRRVKDCIDEMEGREQRGICEKIGEGIASIHRNGIVHGDITTSNIIIHMGKTYFIDFGLGEKSSEREKQGVDLHLLMEAFKAAHENEELFNWVFDSYEKNFEGASEVIKKVEEIAERGRYVVRG